MAVDPSAPVSKDPGLNVLQALGLSLQSLPQVTVAKIDGRCRGGGTTLLPLKAGRGRALEIMLTSRDFSGTEAAQYNFINRAFATALEMEGYVATSAGQMAVSGLPVIQAIKAVSKVTMASMADGLLAGLAQENASMAECLSDPVVLERLKALAVNAGTREAELDLPATIENM